MKIAKVAYNGVTRRLPSDPPDDDGSSSIVADRSFTAEGDVGDACLYTRDRVDYKLADT